MQCPVGLKLNNLAEVLRINENEIGSKQKIYFDKTNDGKQILRDMMGQYVPNDITRAEKQGFSSPDASWFKGESIDFINRRLLAGDALINQVLDRDATEYALTQHLSGEKNRRLLVWSFLNLEYWFNDNLV